MSTINNVPRELLERVAKPVLFKSQEDAHADACAAIRALLSAQSPTCCGHAACNSLGEPHPFCNFVSALDAAPSPADHVEDVRAMVVPSIEAAYAIGAKGGSVVDAERLAFESWMAGHCWALGAAWDGTGYRCESEQAGQFSPAAGMTRQLWAAWRDRAALAATASVQQIAQNGGQA